MTKYYLSIILGVIGFIGGTVIIPANLNINPPLYQKIFVVNDTTDIKYIDTLTISNRIWKFQMNEANNVVVDSIRANTYRTIHYSEFYYNNNPKFLLWLVFMAIGLAFALAMLPFLIHHFTGLNHTRKWIALVIAVVSIVVVFYASHRSTPHLTMLPHRIINLAQFLFYPNPWILQALVSVYMIPPLLALASNFIITQKLITLHHLGGDGELGQLLNLKRELFWLLASSSLMLVMGIVTSSLLRESVITAAGKDLEFFFPFEFVLSYSLVFTFFLIIFYGPSNILLRQLIAKEVINNENSKVNAPAQNSNIESFELTISVLAPVISGLLMDWLT